MAIGGKNGKKKENIYDQIAKQYGHDLTMKPKSSRGEKKDYTVNFRTTDDVGRMFRILREQYSSIYPEKSDLARVIFNHGVKLVWAVLDCDEGGLDRGEFELALEMDELREKEDFLEDLINMKKRYEDGINKGLSTNEQMELGIKRALQKAPDKMSRDAGFKKVATPMMMTEGGN